MAASYEIWSFASKLLQLSSNGFSADMHVGCSAGKISISLSTELDAWSSTTNNQRECKRKPPSPSRLRRRERRRNARENKTECSSGKSDNEHRNNALVVNVAEKANIILSSDTEDFNSKLDSNHTGLIEEEFYDGSGTTLASSKVHESCSTPNAHYSTEALSSSKLLDEPNLIDLADAYSHPTIPTAVTDLNRQPPPAEPGPTLMESQMLEMLRYLTSRT